MSNGRRLTARGRERRQQILDLATELFAARGYHPTSVADIVDGLGVGKGVFYWYFESKEELFEEILRESQKEMRRAQQSAISDLDDPVARIEAGIRAAVEWSANNRQHFHLFEFAQTDERFANLVRRGRAVLARDAVPQLDEAISRGLIPDGDPDELAYAILGVSTMLTMVHIHQRNQPADEVADAVVRFCLGGIGAETGPRGS